MTVHVGELALGARLDIATTDQLHPLGTIARGPSGQLYRYVKFLDAVTYVAGHVVTLASASTWNVTNDRAGGSSLAAHIPVGVVISSPVPTQNQFGWVQISGIATVLHSSAAVAIGDRMVTHATTDGGTDEADYTAVAHLDFLSVGIALAATGSGSTGPMLLTLPV